MLSEAEVTYPSPLSSQDFTTASLLSSFVESLPEGVLILDRVGTVLYLNQSGAVMLGLENENCLGRHVSDIVDFRPVVLRALETGRGYLDKEFHIDSPSRGRLHFLKSAIMLRDKRGEVMGVIDSFRKLPEARTGKQTGGGACSRYTFADILGGDPQFLNAKRLAEIASSTDATVLLDGESGTGKELIAHAIHSASERRDGPFVVVNCAGLPDSLIESELFGHAPGSFTGASREGYMGKFEQATSGTIFLDEIGELPLEMQSKLLRVVQDKTFTRLGSSSYITTDVRIIVATNRNLEEEVARKHFRGDLFYRLNVLRITLPPLRQRRKDIFLLTDAIVEKLACRYGVLPPKISAGVRQLLHDYAWPGNIRELENVLERAIILSGGCGELTAETIPLRPERGGCEESLYEGISQPTHPAEPVRQERVMSLEAVERAAILAALEQNQHNITSTARRLGISRNTLYRKMEKYQLIEQFHSA
jgi:PAS domain S-box-containing protein